MNLTRSGNWSRGPIASPSRSAPRAVHQVANRGTGQAPFLDHADLVVIVGQLPALGVIGPVADRLVQDRSQAPASPDQPAQDGFESQGIKRASCHLEWPITSVRRLERRLISFRNRPFFFKLMRVSCNPFLSNCGQALQPERRTVTSQKPGKSYLNKRSVTRANCPIEFRRGPT